jgi:hypothetical protein
VAIKPDVLLFLFIYISFVRRIKGGQRVSQLMSFEAVDGIWDGGNWRFHTQTECISRIIKFDSKQKANRLL